MDFHRFFDFKGFQGFSLVFKDFQEETHKQTERRRHLGFDQGRQWMSSKEDN